MRRGGRNGVTLVELLIVLVILSIALSIVLPALNKGYESWLLRTSGQRIAALFRSASDTARREGVEIAGYCEDDRLVLLRKGAIYRELTLPMSIGVSPQKPGGVVFLPTGQILSSDTFVLASTAGRKATIVFGPLPGEVSLKEGAP